MSLDEVMKELRVEYLASIESKFSMYREMAKLRQATDLEQEFHKLKGTGSTYGIPEISELGEAVENLMMTHKKEGLELLESILELLQAVINGHRAQEPVALRENSTFQKLQDLTKPPSRLNDKTSQKR